MLTIPGRVPITIHPLFWLFALFIGWMSTYTLTGALLWLIVILISVLIHEYGHAFTAMLFKQNVKIELAAFGGFTYRQGPKLKLWQEFLVVLNGPVAGLCLFAISWFLLNGFGIVNPTFTSLLKIAVYVNLFWTLINLVPMMPLDGGHLMSIILEGIFGYKGIKASLILSIVIGICVSAFFLIIGAWLVAALFIILTFESSRSLKFYRMLSEKDRDTSVQELMKEAETSLMQGKEGEALNQFLKVREKANKGLFYSMATEAAADILVKMNKAEQAYELLLPLKKDLTNESLALLHEVAFKRKDYQTVSELSDKVYQHSPSYETALMNAIAFGQLGSSQPAVGWLECSIRDGLPSIKETISLKDFDPVRHDPQFKKFEQDSLS